MNINDNGGAFRKKKIYFSQVSNYALRDENLSLKAKGLYSLIQSYITIEGFVLYKNTLKKDCSEGNTAFESAWNELKKFGYLKQFKLKTPEGYFYYEYDLIDIIHIPENEGVDNLPCGKGGIYNNTNSNDTNYNNTYSNCNNDLSKPEKITFDVYVEQWNQMYPLFAKVTKLTPKRESAIKARLKDGYTQENILSVFESVKHSDFLSGKNNNSWKADFDWVFNPNNFVKIIEGKYDNKESRSVEKKEKFADEAWGNN